jgi:hypothetical protein
MRTPILRDFSAGDVRNGVSSDLDRASRKAPPGAAIAGFGLMIQEFCSLSQAGPSGEVLNQNHARIMD